ncbi:DNA-processing protein DprA [Streptomyces mirabilis]|uniref:DNA-processing protein DprA n=1 Tax=Streptomyces mirabilis TaxID=68239 RepID=UPI0033233658
MPDSAFWTVPRETAAAEETASGAAEAAVRTMAAYPITLVSGLANGIDAAAHQAALRDGVRNVAFLGHGIAIVFPAETADVRVRIIRTGRAVATEYLSEEHFRKAQFVQRNRLQAALADIVVAAEDERGDGTAHTVRFASAYRRPVIGFTWPAPVTWLLSSVKSPTGQLIDIFSAAGRRSFDTLCRGIAHAVPPPSTPVSKTDRHPPRPADEDAQVPARATTARQAWTLPMGWRQAASMGTTMNVTGSASEGPFGCRTRSPGVPRC